MNAARTNSPRGWRSLAAIAIAAACLGVLPAGAVTQFRMPTPEVRTLDNGLQVAFFPDARLPIVQALLLIPAGSAADPSGQEGAAYLTAEMLRRGTSSRSASAFANEIDRLGAMLTTNATRDYSTVANAFLARDLDAGLELMSDAVIQPLFDEGELRKVQEQALATFGQLRRSPSNFAGEQVWAAVFEGHPYARPVFGLPETMSTLTPAAVRAFYGRHYRPDRVTLAIVGNVPAERAFAVAKDWFGRWEGKSTPEPEVPFPLDAKSTGRLKIRLFDAAELKESEIRIGLATPGRGHADETALSLASAVFGGVPTSRLGRLAIPGALGRDARSLQIFQKSAGVFTMGVTIAGDSAGLAVGRLLDELRRFRSEPPTPAEIAPVRRVARNLLPVQFDAGGAVIGHWSTTRFQGLPEGSYDRQRERLETITPEEVAAAARRWLDPDRAIVIAVGPAAVLRPQLEKLGDVEVIRLDAPAAAKAPAPEVPAPSRESGARAKEIVKQALTAHGGTARLRTLKDSTVEADATFILGGRELHGRLVQIRKEPYKMRFSTAIEGIASEQALNGRHAWSVTTSLPDATPKDMDSLAVVGLRNGFESDLPHLLLAATDPASQVVGLGRRALGARATDAVEVRRGGSLRVLYFDPRTHHLIAMDQHESQGAGGGNQLAARRIYGDLRPVGGILWPYSEERWIEGERIMTLSVTRVALDSGVDDSIFDRPEPALPPPAR